MSWKALFRQFKTAEYYLNLIFAFIPTLFIIQLWQYLGRFFELGVNREQLVLYFVLVYSVAPFFHFAFVKSLFAHIFKDDTDLILLPRPFLITIFVKVYRPLVIAQLPLVLLSLGLFAYFIELDVRQFLLFSALIVFSFIYHFFFALLLALMFVKTKVALWLDFFLRQEAFLWGGAYVPLLFFPEFLRQIIYFIPFAYSVLAGQLYFNGLPGKAELFGVGAYFFLFVILAPVLLKKYIRYVQI